MEPPTLPMEPHTLQDKLTGSELFGEKSGDFSLKQDRMRADSTRAK